jgi:phenylacetate-CoA ligase
VQSEQRQRSIRSFEEFLNTSLEELLQHQQSRDFESKMLSLFQNVAATVPAYRDFLAAANIDRASIQTFADFQKLPLITKENYLRRYPLPQLCRQGKSDFLAAFYQR